MDAQLRIGIVEDNDDLRESLVDVLHQRGHVAVGFSCAEDLSDSPESEVFDLLVLDLNLPGEDGLSVASRLKRVQPGLRVIMMTTRIAVSDRVRGYDLGADLYLPKPVAEDELLAAVRALGRQIQAEALKTAEAKDALLHLEVHTLLLRSTRGHVLLNGVEVSLLSALARAPGQRLEHWQLIEKLGYVPDDASRANLAVRMTRLRQKLAQVGLPAATLRSLRASGYQLCVPLEIR